jgi:putative transposase
MDECVYWRSQYTVCMRIQSLSHCRYQHQYHIVWGTKYRRKYLKPYVKEEFLSLLFSYVKKYPKLHIFAVNTDLDHIHLQIEIAPDISVSRVVQRLKGYTSLKLKQKFKFIKKIYLDEGIWSVGYFSSTIGLNEQQIKQYIAYQGRLDRPKQIKFRFS